MRGTRGDDSIDVLFLEGLACYEYEQFFLAGFASLF